MTTAFTKARDDEAQPPNHAVGSSARRLLDRALLIGAAAAALLLIGGVLITFVGVFRFRHPYVGWTDIVVADAKSVATGHFQYVNPATQPAGIGYSPLFTWLLAGLLRVYWWEGWGPVVSMLAVAGGLVALVRLSWSVTGTRAARLATACVVVVLVLGGLSAFDWNGLYEARPDQLAWSLFVIAGAMTFRGFLSADGVSLSRRLVIGLLLAASVATKQPTLVPCVIVAALATAAPRERHATEPRTWRTRLEIVAAPLAFVAALAVLGIALQIASRGYAYDLLVRDNLSYGRYFALGQEIRWSFHRMVVLFVAFVVVAVSAAWSLAADRGRPRRQVFVAAAAVVVALSPLPTAILAEATLGGYFNQLIGPVWTLALGSTVLMALLRPRFRQLVASSIACGVLLVGVGVVPRSLLHDKVGKPSLDLRAHWVGMDPYLYAVVDRGQAVYDFNAQSLSASLKAPKYPAGDWVDRFAAGYTPRYFIRNLLEGRYALVKPIPVDVATSSYMSGLGRYDASIGWKINALLTKAYEPVQDPVTHAFYFAPGPRLSQYRWFAQCFGPWAASDAGIGVRVRGSGGLVCARTGALQLTEAPAAATELVTTLREGRGDATLHFASPPTVLALTPLSGRDGATSTTSAQVAPIVDQCLATHGHGQSLTLRAVAGEGAWTCRAGAASAPVLEIPVARGGTAHLAIELAAADSPRLTAASSSGRAARFEVVNSRP